MWRTVLRALTILTLAAGLSPAAGADAPATAEAVDLRMIRAATSGFPPYTIADGTGVHGQVVNRMRQVLFELGVKPPIELYPFARLLRVAIEQPGVLAFSMARTPDREQALEWIGEVGRLDVALFRRTQRTDIDLLNLDDARRYVLGALRADFKTNYLVRHGFDPQIYADEDNGVEMLLRDRFDLMAADRNALLYRVRQSGLSEQSVTAALPLPDLSTPLYAVLSVKTPPKIVAAVRAAYERARSGTDWDNPSW